MITCTSTVHGHTAKHLINLIFLFHILFVYWYLVRCPGHMDPQLRILNEFIVLFNNYYNNRNNITDCSIRVSMIISSVMFLQLKITNYRWLSNTFTCFFETPTVHRKNWVTCIAKLILKWNNWWVKFGVYSAFSPTPNFPMYNVSYQWTSPSYIVSHFYLTTKITCYAQHCQIIKAQVY